MRELSLTGNQNLSDVRRLKWLTEADASPEPVHVPSPLRGTQVTIAPQEVRTFALTVQKI